MDMIYVGDDENCRNTLENVLRKQSKAAADSNKNTTEESLRHTSSNRSLRPRKILNSTKALPKLKKQLSRKKYVQHKKNDTSDTKFGKGEIGKTLDEYKKIDDFSFKLSKKYVLPALNEKSNSLTQQLTNFKEQQDKLLLLQQQTLLQQPEFFEECSEATSSKSSNQESGDVNISSENICNNEDINNIFDKYNIPMEEGCDNLHNPRQCDEIISNEEPIIGPVQLPLDKQELIEKFMTSMSADRIDYEKPKKLNIVEGVFHARPSEAHFVDNELPSSKTIVQRIDFGKDNLTFNTDLLSSSLTNDFTNVSDNLILKDLVATSTPLSKNDTDLYEMQCRVNELSDINRISVCNEEDDFDLSQLDRSCVTIRTTVNKKTTTTNISGMDNKEDDISQFIDNVMKSTEKRYALEKLDNLGESVSRLAAATNDIIKDALDKMPLSSTMEEDSVIVIDDYHSTDPVEIIESVHIIDSDDSDSVIEVEDILIPSTSTKVRTKKNRRLKRKGDEERSTENARKKKREIIINEESMDKPFLQNVRDCPICLEPFANQEISSTICGHVFCTACVKESVKKKKSCPTCRSALTLKKIHPLFL